MVSSGVKFINVMEVIYNDSITSAMIPGTVKITEIQRQLYLVKNGDVLATSLSTIRHTGISIIYTSLVLIAGFIIFCFSGFGGTQALGWLTSLTLVVATFTNLILLPALLISSIRKK